MQNNEREYFMPHVGNIYQGVQNLAGFIYNDFKTTNLGTSLDDFCMLIYFSLASVLFSKFEKKFH